MNHPGRFTTSLTLAVALVSLSACRRRPAPPPPAAPPTVSKATAAPTPSPIPAGPVAGGELNAFFPASGADGYDRVFTQEKDGVVLAELSKGGRKLATLSISDTASSPGSLGKYETATKRIAGLPAAEVGSNATAVLVAKRFQVQVRSNDPGFTASDREAWIQRFRLAELAAYAGRR